MHRGLARAGVSGALACRCAVGRRRDGELSGQYGLFLAFAAIGDGVSRIEIDAVAGGLDCSVASDTAVHLHTA